MGFSSFWSSITSPRVREISAPRKRGQDANDRRPATSSGVRTIRRTPSLDDDEGRELNLVESLLTTNIIEPSAVAEPTLEEKKARRRSRGLSLSRSKNDDGLKRRRSLFGGSKDEVKAEEVPSVPTLPTMSAIYSRHAPHTLGDVDRPSTAISAISPSPSARAPESGQVFELAATRTSVQQQKRSPNATGEVFELPAELPTTTQTTKAATALRTEQEVKRSRRRSLGEVLSGKRPKSNVYERLTPGDANAPPTPKLPETTAKTTLPKLPETGSKVENVRSRRNSNASVASKASKMSRKSKRKSWWQRGKAEDEDTLLPPMPTKPKPAKTSPETTKSTKDVDLSAFPTVPATKKPIDDDDAASIRTTRSEKSISRSKSRKRAQSTASHTRQRRRKSWWTSSNPDDSDSGDDSNPLPPVPLLIRSTRTTPDSSPTNSDNYGRERAPSYIAVRGDDIKAPRPLSTVSTKSRTYTPRSAAKSFLVSTTPVSDSVRKSVRHSLHGGEDLSGFENGNGTRDTYCLSQEQQREWEKLKHLMAVMDRRRDVTMKTFGEASVAEMFPATPRSLAAGGAEGEQREGVKYSNRDALAALEVGVAK